MNNQPISKRLYHPRGYLSVFHIFKTIQGEGPYAGHPAIFIRLSGCNLQCPQCDTDYTSRSDLISPQEILDRIEALGHPSRLVVITGGEPLRQNLTPLVIKLQAARYRIQIETNGTLPPCPGLPITDVTIVCSPKTGALNSALVGRLAALKYVVHADKIDPEDGLPLTSLDHTAKPRVARPPSTFFGVIYVQPIDVGNRQENQRHIQAAVSSCMQFGYNLCIQIHKYVGLE